jgi:hypothetical protein
VENMILLSMEFSKHSWAFQNQHLLVFFAKDSNVCSWYLQYAQGAICVCCSKNVQTT